MVSIIHYHQVPTNLQSTQSTFAQVDLPLRAFPRSLPLGDHPQVRLGQVSLRPRFTSFRPNFRLRFASQNLYPSECLYKISASQLVYKQLNNLGWCGVIGVGWFQVTTMSNLNLRSFEFELCLRFDNSSYKNGNIWNQHINHQLHSLFHDPWYLEWVGTRNADYDQLQIVQLITITQSTSQGSLHKKKLHFYGRYLAGRSCHNVKISVCVCVCV